MLRMLSYQHQNPDHAEEVLNYIADFYVRQNVERNSVEAKKSLDFLRVQLPQIKTDLEQAETRFNDFQKAQESVNITLETQAVLEQIVENPDNSDKIMGDHGLDAALNVENYRTSKFKYINNYEKKLPFSHFLSV